jgi:hypothetical protein
MSPIQLAAAIRPVQGDIAPIAAQADEVIPQVKAKIIELPQHYQGNNGNDYQGGQVKESIQQFIQSHLILWQSN